MVQEFQIGGTSGSVALWTRASSDLRLALMYPLISRRIVALVVAYALALAPVLPLLGAFARAGDLDSADRGALCAGKQVGARFDVVLQLPAGCGQRPVVAEQPPLGQPFFVMTPRCLVVITGAGDVLARDTARRGV